MNEDGCREHEHCLSCPLAECVYEHIPDTVYRKHRLAALDQAKLKELRDKPRCCVPACPDQATRYAWNDGERVLDGYCDGHRSYADSNYYDDRGNV